MPATAPKGQKRARRRVIPNQFKNFSTTMTDPIADYLTRLRNAIKAQHRVVEIPASNLKKEITKILFEQGYILNYKFIEGENLPAPSRWL